MKKTFKNKFLSKLINLSLSLFIVFFAIIISWQGKVLLSPAFAENEQQFEDASDLSSTLFFIDIGAAAINDEDVLIYDDYDKLIKILDCDLVFKQENASFKTNLTNVTNILATDSFILLYDNDSKAFEAYDLSYNLLSFDASVLTTLSSVKQISTVSIDSVNYLLLSPDQDANTFQLAKLSVNQGSLIIDSVISFFVNELYQKIANYECIYLSQSGENLLVMLVTDKKVLSFEVELNKDNQQIDSTTVKNLPEQETILFAKDVKIGDQNVIAMITSSNISFYTFDTSPTLSFEKLSGEIQLNGDQIVTDVTTSEDKILLTLNQDQTAILYTISGTISEYSVSSVRKTNPAITISYLDQEDFEYYKVTQDTCLINSPYSRTKITDIAVNQNVAVIATASSDNQQIIGWYYVLFSSDDTNYFGFIESSALEKMSQEEKTYNNISVLDFTVLRKYPSIITDELNTNLLVINSTANVEVLDGLAGFTSLGTTYLHIKVNNISGFIDVSRVNESDKSSTKIITDAYVTKDSSQIFAEESADSQVIAYLNKGARVKIIGKRDTLTNLTHVKFNAENGQEIEGYIYTYNLKTDTWSMLQIIGMIFVILNLLLLMVIVIIKNRLAK